MNDLVPGAHITGVVMADGRCGGQGGFMPLMNVTALALAVARLSLAVPAEPKFDVDVGLLRPIPPTTNSPGALQPALPNT